MSDSVEAVELTEEQGKALLDKRCRKLLGIGAEEFLREYDAGTAEDRWDHDKVIELGMLIPFYR
jgi:DNA gyrase/topoisomerase IV subunit A